MRCGCLRAFSFNKRINLSSRPNRSLSSRLYAFQFVMGAFATPLSIAARATAGATVVIKRGSKGFGIIYVCPKVKLLSE